MPRSSYKPKNRFLPKARLSEFELYRLLLLWFSGNSHKQIEEKFHGHYPEFEQYVHNLNQQYFSRDPIEVHTEIKKINRQQVSAYLKRIFPKVSDDFFPMTMSEEEKMYGALTFMNQIREFIEDSIDSDVNLEGINVKISELLSMVVNDQKKYGLKFSDKKATSFFLNFFKDTESQTEKELLFAAYRMVSIIVYWHVSSETEPADSYRALGKAPFQVTLDPLVRKMAVERFKKYRGIDVSDFEPHAAFLNCLQFCIGMYDSQKGDDIEKVFKNHGREIGYQLLTGYEGAARAMVRLADIKVDFFKE